MIYSHWILKIWRQQLSTQNWQAFHSRRSIGPIVIHLAPPHNFQFTRIINQHLSYSLYIIQSTISIMTKHDANGNTKSIIMVTGGSGLVGSAIKSYAESNPKDAPRRAHHLPQQIPSSAPLRGAGPAVGSQAVSSVAPRSVFLFLRLALSGSPTQPFVILATPVLLLHPSAWCRGQVPWLEVGVMGRRRRLKFRVKGLGFRV